MSIATEMKVLELEQRVGLIEEALAAMNKTFQRIDETLTALAASMSPMSVHRGKPLNGSRS